MPTSGFPLPLRNALAELALAAFADDAAATAIAWLANPTAPPSPAALTRLAAAHLVDPGDPVLLPVHRPHAEAVAAHAARAVQAVGTFTPAGAEGSTPRACRVAASLWNERLFFEVHEVLEAVWKTASGAERQALQGVIQIAVAFHHLAHGNRRGARSLLVEGRDRLANVPPTTLSLDLERLLRDTSAWDAALTGDGSPPAAPPRLALN